MLEALFACYLACAVDQGHQRDLPPTLVQGGGPPRTPPVWWPGFLNAAKSSIDAHFPEALSAVSSAQAAAELNSTHNAALVDELRNQMDLRFKQLPVDLLRDPISYSYLKQRLVQDVIVRLEAEGIRPTKR